MVCPERSEPPKAGANGLHKAGAETDEGGITIVVSPSMVTGLENSEIGRIGGRMIRPNDPVGGEGKVGRGRQKVGCPERQSR